MNSKMWEAAARTAQRDAIDGKSRRDGDGDEYEIVVFASGLK